MKRQSADVCQRVNEGSFHLNPAAQSFRLTGFHHRNAPQLIRGLVSTLIVLTGITLACVALFTRNLLVDNDRPDLQQDSLRTIREAAANSEALPRAIRADDHAAIQRCRKKLTAHEDRQKHLHEREARWLAEHAIAEQALRQRYGALAGGLISAGLVLP